MTADWVTDRLTQEQAIETHSTLYHLHTVWLFTRNDLKSIVYPETAFGYASS